MEVAVLMFGLYLAFGEFILKLASFTNIEIALPSERFYPTRQLQ